MMNFHDYNAGRPDESAVLSEFFSGPLTKTAVIALVMKVSQLRQRIEQDPKADPAQKSIAAMVFMLASMLSLDICTRSDPQQGNKAKGSFSR
jgi:hypothetical protein